VPEIHFEKKSLHKQRYQTTKFIKLLWLCPNKQFIKLRLELKINAQACINGLTFVFASNRSLLHEGHEPRHTQYNSLYIYMSHSEEVKMILFISYLGIFRQSQTRKISTYETTDLKRM
jgi:hypothetical protein